MSKKVQIEKPKTETVKKAPAKKPKKKLSNEEIKELLTKSIAELDVITKELTEEKGKVQTLNLKRIMELVDETLKNLAEDTQEMKDKIKELDGEVIEE